MTLQEEYNIWWDEEGSGIRPEPNEDMEEFANRITRIAWGNGAYKERERVYFELNKGMYGNTI